MQFCREIAFYTLLPDVIVNATEFSCALKKNPNTHIAYRLEVKLVPKAALNAMQFPKEYL